MDTQLKLLGRSDAPTAHEPIKHLKPSVDPSTLHHRQLLDERSGRRSRPIG